jgi:hypothetical protein
MSIKLTKTINGKKVELDLISLRGKTTVRSESFANAKKKGLAKKDLEEFGFGVEE